MKPHASRNKKYFCLVLAVFASAVLLGCAASHPKTTAQPVAAPAPRPVPENLVVPAGVDTSVAISATWAAREVLVGWKEDSIARQLYNEGSAQRDEGKPLLDAIQKGRSTPESISQEDSLKSMEWLNQANEAGAKGDHLINNKTPGHLTREGIEKYSDSTRQHAANFYETARDLYEKSLQLDPWNRETHSALLLTYRDLVVIHRSLNSLDAEMIAIQKYLTMFGDQYGYLTELARCYEEKGDTVQALISYRRAEDALLTWAPTSWDPETDSARTTLTPEQHRSWIALITQEYNMDYALQLNEPAMADLQRLKSTCTSTADSATLNAADGLISWLSWDDGNIASARIRKNLRAQIDAGQWEDARKTITQLLPILSNSDAKFETEYSAAQIDFYRLGEYDSGLLRMRQLLDQSGYSEVNDNLDTLLSRYGTAQFVQRMADQRAKASERVVKLLDDYGNCCLTYGIQLEPTGKEKAFVYYYQAALIPWKRQGEALSVLADLSRNQPDRAILYGETALAPGLSESIDATSRGTLYSALREAYRRKNDRAHTEYYHQALLRATNGGGK